MPPVMLEAGDNPGRQWRDKMKQVLWGYKVGQHEWEEQPIIETDDTELLAKAKQWAADNSFVGLRVMRLDGLLPDFVNTVNV